MNNCEICENLQGLCNLHKPKETAEERQMRKATWMARATAHFDTPEIRKEAEDRWEEANKEE